MTPASVSKELNSLDGIVWDETPDLVGPSSTDEAPVNESDSATDDFEENFARARTRSRSVNFILRLNENKKSKVTQNTTVIHPTDSANDTPSAHRPDTIHTPTSLAISNGSKNTVRSTSGSPLPTFNRLSLVDEFSANDSKNSTSAHVFLEKQGSESHTSAKRASADNNTTNTKASPSQTPHAGPDTVSKFEMLPQELRDQIYPDLAANLKEDILPHGWQETNRPWKSRRKTVQRTHYDGPGHYVKRSYFKGKFAGGSTAPPHEKHAVLPRKRPRTARHNRDCQHGVAYGGKDVEKHKSENHQQFVSPRMAVGGYKILMMGNKSFAAEVSSYIFEEMQINAKRRQDYGGMKVEYRSDDLRAYFEKHPEYAAHTKRLIIMVNLGQAKMTYEALVEILQPFKILQHVLIKVFFAGLWSDSLAPSIEKFRDLLVLKRGFERTGYVTEDGWLLKDRIVEFKFEHAVPQRSGQILESDERASMEERYQKRWEAVTKEWNGIGSHLD